MRVALIDWARTRFRSLRIIRVLISSWRRSLEGRWRGIGRARHGRRVPDFRHISMSTGGKSGGNVFRCRPDDRCVILSFASTFLEQFDPIEITIVEKIIFR